MIPVLPEVAAEGFKPAVKVIFGVLVLLIAALFGASLMYDHEEAKLEKLKRTHAEEQANAAEAARQRLESAQRRGDLLTERLAKAQDDADLLQKEHAREIKRLTTGRPCLNAGTVQLLNGTGQGIKAPGAAAPAGQPAPGDAATGSDPGVGPEATDTDVALWIDYAKRQYDTCRGRLQALIDWWAE